MKLTLIALVSVFALNSFAQSDEMGLSKSDPMYKAANAERLLSQKISAQLTTISKNRELQIKIAKSEAAKSTTTANSVSGKKSNADNLAALSDLTIDSIMARMRDRDNAEYLLGLTSEVCMNIGELKATKSVTENVAMTAELSKFCVGSRKISLSDAINLADRIGHRDLLLLRGYGIEAVTAQDLSPQPKATTSAVQSTKPRVGAN
jgi:hypothetical protein